jgi:CRP/FNR family cyclic AMP-dependent transcriptional regulator
VPAGGGIAGAGVDLRGSAPYPSRMANSEPLFDGLGEQDGIELVQRTPLFHSLNFDETRRLFKAARLERRSAGSVIVEANAIGEALYIVKEGTVRVIRDGTILGVLGPGELFGEMSLVDDLFTSASVAAESEVELIVLPRPGFELLITSDQGLAVKVYRAFCRTLSDRLRRANVYLPADQRLRHAVQ